MSNKTRLQANNNELQEILDSVNALPEAGGASTETCSVTIDEGGNLNAVFYTTIVDGVPTFKCSFREGDDWLASDWSILKNSYVILSGADSWDDIILTGEIVNAQDVNYVVDPYSYAYIVVCYVQGDGTISLW